MRSLHVGASPGLALRVREAQYDPSAPRLRDFGLDRPPRPEALEALDRWVDSPAVRTPLLIEVQGPELREPLRRLWALAVAVPMLAAAPAHAAAPPFEIDGPAARADDETTPPNASGAPEPESPSSAAAHSDDSPATAPAAAPPPRSPTVPATPDELSLTGRTLWDGLRNIELRLELVDGKVLAGTIIQQTDDTLLLAVDGYSEPFAVPKAQVRGVALQRVALGDPEPVGPRPKRGTGLLAGGISLVVVGALAVAGAGVANSPSVLLYFGVPGAAAVGAGIPMIVVGAKRRKDYREAQRKLSRVLPGAYVTRQGAGASLSLRF